jgi:ferrous iron transport protein A
MSLAKTPLAKTVRVRGIRSSGPHSCRLMELGLIEGAEVEIIGRAPFGDPLHLRIGDYELSLRATDAELIDVA